MNWITNYVRPTLRTVISKKADTPENLWSKCPSCEQMVFHRDLTRNLLVCPHCDHHMRMTAKQRLELLYDDGTYTLVPVPPVPHDPLKFKDSKNTAIA